jgi:ATP-dependent Lhr-like helicase
MAHRGRAGTLKCDALCLQEVLICEHRWRDWLPPPPLTESADTIGGHLALPDVVDKTVAGLKFSAALPKELAVATLAARLADFDHAAAVLAAPVRFESQLS